MKVNGIPINIPEGDRCLHTDGHLCCLYNAGINGHPSCHGWDNPAIIDLKKHEECLRFCVPAEDRSSISEFNKHFCPPREEKPL